MGQVIPDVFGFSCKQDLFMSRNVTLVTNLERFIYRLIYKEASFTVLIPCAFNLIRSGGSPEPESIREFPRLIAQTAGHFAF